MKDLSICWSRSEVREDEVRGVGVMGSSIHASLLRVACDVSAVIGGGSDGSVGKVVALDVSCKLAAVGISVARG